MKWTIAIVVLVLSSAAMADHRDYYGSDRFGASLRFNWEHRGGSGSFDRYERHYSDYGYRPIYRDYRDDRCDPPVRYPYLDQHPYHDTYRGRAYERNYHDRW